MQLLIKYSHRSGAILNRSNFLIVLIYAIFLELGMLKFIPEKEHLREVLTYYCKKTPVESYRILCEAYGEHASSQDTCEIY